MNYLIPESSRKKTMTQNPGTRAEMAENVVERVTLTKTVLFLPNWSVRNPDTCDDIAIPKNETLDSIPLRIVSNSKSHLAGGMIKLTPKVSAIPYIKQKPQLRKT